MNFKSWKGMVSFTVVFALAYKAMSASYPHATGDIADNGASGWNGQMPDATGVAAFQQANGTYTAGGQEVMLNSEPFQSVRILRLTSMHPVLLLCQACTLPITTFHAS